MRTPRDPRLPRHRGLYYGGGWHESDGGRTIAVMAPATRRAARRDGRRHGGRRRSRRHAPRERRFPRGAIRPRRNGRRRSARPPAILLQHADELAWLEALDTGNPFQAMRFDVEISVGLHGVLRRARHRDQGQHDPDRRRHAQLHAARAAGRGRQDRRVQPSAALHRGQVRRSARRRQHARRQAGRIRRRCRRCGSPSSGTTSFRRACSTS